MKVIIADERPITTNGSIPRIRVGADSAVLRIGDPLFVPDHLGEWHSVVCPAIRISRLGTNIPPKAAHTYFDGIAPMHILSPSDGSGEGIYTLMDRAFAHGRWRGIDTADTAASHIITIKTIFDDGFPTPPETSIEFTLATLDANETISAISRYCTLKMGDIIAFGHTSASTALFTTGSSTPQAVITALFDDEESLKLKIR